VKQGTGKQQADGKAQASSGRRLASTLPAERTWNPDREAMLAALRVVLGLPRVPARLGGPNEYG